MVLKLSREECFSEFADERTYRLRYFLLIANSIFLHKPRRSSISVAHELSRDINCTAQENSNTYRELLPGNLGESPPSILNKRPSSNDAVEGSMLRM